MDVKFDNGALSIMLPPKITGENCSVFEKELLAIEQLRAAKEIFLNADKLNYISSLGLRVILKFRKQYRNIPVSVLNTAESIYKIFDDTGFTSFLNIKKKLRIVDTAGLEMIDSGMYGSVYRINDEQILKVFRGIQTEGDIEPVINTIRVAFVHDIPTIMPFEIVRTEEGIGLILELLHSETLSKLIMKNPQNLDNYVNKMVELSKLLARTNFEAGSLRSRNEMLISKLNSATAYLAAEEIGVVKKYIELIPRCNTAVHGDFHAKNLMVSEDMLMLIDMDEFSMGHPLWDIANLYCIYQTMAHIDREIADDLFDLNGQIPYEDFYFQIIDCSIAKAEIIWEKFFNGYFADYSQEDKTTILKLADFYGNFKFVTFLIDVCNFRKDKPEKLACKVRNLRYFLEKLQNDYTDMSSALAYLKSWK